MSDTSRLATAAGRTRVLALGRSGDLDLHSTDEQRICLDLLQNIKTHLDRRRREHLDLALDAVSDSGVHGCAAGEDDVVEQLLANVEVTVIVDIVSGEPGRNRKPGVPLEDRVVRELGDAGTFEADERGLEERLGGAEPFSLVSSHYKRSWMRLVAPFVPDRDDVAVGQLVRLLERRGLRRRLHLLLKVQRDVAELFFDVAYDFPLSGGRERVSPLEEALSGRLVGEL